MSMLQTYIIMVLIPNFNIFLCTICVISSFLFAFLGVICVANAYDEDLLTRSKMPLKYCAVLFLISLSISVFFPDENQIKESMIVYYGTNSKEAKNVPSQLSKILDEYVISLEDKNKKNK